MNRYIVNPIEKVTKKVMNPTVGFLAAGALAATIGFSIANAEAGQQGTQVTAEAKAKPAAEAANNTAAALEKELAGDTHKKPSPSAYSLESKALKEETAAYHDEQAALNDKSSADAAGSDGETATDIGIAGVGLGVSTLCIAGIGSVRRNWG